MLKVGNKSFSDFIEQTLHVLFKNRKYILKTVSHGSIEILHNEGIEIEY